MRELVKSMGEPYDDPDKIRELYHGEEMTQQGVADFLGCSKPTIIRRMEEFGIEARDPGGGDPEAAHKDEDVVRRLYEDEGLSLRAVADRLGTDEATLRYWMDRFGIQRRNRYQHLRRQPAHYRTSTNGYEVWQVRDEAGRHQVKVHRLAAVAWYGLSAVEGKEVHHQNGVKWDTREKNVTLMTKEKHSRHHANETEFWTYRDDVEVEEADV